MVEPSDSERAILDELRARPNVRVDAFRWW
jgi:hypothetical protein